MKKSIRAQKDLHPAPAQCLGCEHAGGPERRPQKRSSSGGDEGWSWRPGCSAKNGGVYGGGEGLFSRGIGSDDAGVRKKSKYPIPDDASGFEWGKSCPSLGALCPYVPKHGGTLSGAGEGNAYPQKIIQLSFGEPGQCFAVQGGSGFVEIKLKMGIITETVTLEHVSKEAAEGRPQAEADHLPSSQHSRRMLKFASYTRTRTKMLHQGKK
ncbi:protein SAD1/UNC-84 domain protein 1-like [Panicum miliaceum]|uniref:Protein SAD1/UNC-84 domain protein 1-like n=1 Tax=Panicum miliaceum TaxID=4540 RepID=A0A3L6QN40_PANMI|nr:protein SAD1/UNC-84 domain protein 1-like [Panicum miliaceum]